jgi:hypothetical protein
MSSPCIISLLLGLSQTTNFLVTIILGGDSWTLIIILWLNSKLFHFLIPLMKQKSVSFDVTLRQELCKHQSYLFIYFWKRNKPWLLTLIYWELPFITHMKKKITWFLSISMKCYYLLLRQNIFMPVKDKNSDALHLMQIR